MTVGTHVLLEHWGGAGLRDSALMETAMRGAATAARATVLSAHFHGFPGGGFTGVLLLAESHITVHTWPELNYAALDLFLCGNADVTAAVEALATVLCPAEVQVQRIARGSAPVPAA